ncbi:chitobiase/beta-hexosaminidase C-terminal domain-containing protein [Arthrobacter crystallopoietes]|nr:chitobiase/beta-hexosaminidase C-terminal domain-containing protein [Arthrobacter crystallopoietes]
MTSDPEIKLRPPNGRRSQRRRAVGVAAAGAVLLSGLSVLPPATAAALPAGGAGLSQSALAGMLPAALPKGPAGVGPINPDNGYPYWYGDSGDAAKGLAPIRLELCVDAAACPVIGVDYDPTQPLTVPGNFPEESFWWSAETEVTMPDGAEALLVMAQEAAFSGAGEVADGQQNAFARLRIRLDDGVPGQQYTFTHPYGVDVLTADDRGRIRFTEDIGCMQQPCSWDEPSEGRIGPFLRWTEEAPDGFIGDPNIQHEVVGSPHDTNFFRVSGPAGPDVQTAETNLFAVQGKIATIEAGVDKPGGLYHSAQTVKIHSSFPEGKIIYTVDGTDPVVNEDGTVTGIEYVPTAGAAVSEVAVDLATPGTNTLKYISIDPATDETTEIYTEVYELDAARPWLEATPDTASPLAGPQLVTLSGNTNNPAVAPEIYYTTDGSTPSFSADGEPLGNTWEYTEPMQIGTSVNLRAVAVDPATGTAGEIRSFPFKVHNLQEVGPTSEEHGFPEWLRDNGWEGQEPVQLDLCLEDPLCPVVEERPDPESPTSFPDNFPGEAFWFASESVVDVGGEEVQLTLASEAAFGADMVRDGDQVAFGRIRVRGDGVFEPGATYKFTHPYGVLELAADVDGNINYTEDLGALNGTGEFSHLLEAKIGPFLRWDEGAPTGYLGDGNTPHAVVGSPYDTNFFKVEQVTEADGEELSDPDVLGQTDEFVVQGKMTNATPPEAPTATAATAGGLFAADQLVALTSTPDTAQIFFTTDGTEPTEDSTLYTEPIAITNEGITTLKFLAINFGIPSEVVTETFTLDKTAPALTGTPEGEMAAGTAVTLAADGNAAIYYTLDGTEPSNASTLYAAPVQLSAGQTLRAVAIDEAGNTSAIGTWTTAAAEENPGEGEENPGDGEEIPGEGEEEPGETPGETPGEEPAAAESSNDFTSDGKADLITTDRTGKLWLYVGKNNGGYEPRKQIGWGWTSMTSLISTGDTDGDGKADLVARDTAGKLWHYAGKGTGWFEAKKQIGWGWNIMTSIVGSGDFNGDDKNDLVARDKAGDLWLYAGHGNGWYAPKQKIGWGWNSMTMIVGPGDFNGDGEADLVTRDRAGDLFLYAGDGNSSYAPKRKIGWGGWNSMTMIVGPGDMSGDGKADLVTRDRAGNLYLYVGDGKGRMAPKQKIGWGWNMMNNIL